MSNNSAPIRAINIISAAEFRDAHAGFEHGHELLHWLGSIRYCKAERYGKSTIGTVRVPQKSGERAGRLSFGFSISGGELLLIEDSGRLRQLVRQSGLAHDTSAPDVLLLRLLSLLTDGDVLYLSHMEQELDRLEDALIRDADPADFLVQLTDYRRKLSEFASYYEQLSAMGELLGQGSVEREGWEHFTMSAERLHNDVQQLREGTVHLRELYQARQAATQNRVMGILTIVTTIFLPLTLLTGWYGMNFDMPELHWRYGYLAVIAVAAVVVVLEIIYFKRKKFF